MTLFTDRREAGQLLGHRLAALDLHDPIVLALPRGGVPVAYEVARVLSAPLDVFVVRKLGVPGREELAMGAIASHDVRVLNRDIVESLRIGPSAIEAVAAREGQELARREHAYRGSAPFPDLQGREVILVDDGVATGASMMAAVRAVRTLGPGRIIAAAPVFSRQAYDAVGSAADACATLGIPDPFFGVGQHYLDFSQTDDEEVRALLNASREELRHRDARASAATGGLR